MLPEEARSAEEFFDTIAKSDPERFAEVAERYDVLSEYREERDRQGGFPDRWYKPSGGVPKSMKRRMTEEEFREFREAKKRYRADWAEDFKYAKRLADEGL